MKILIGEFRQESNSFNVTLSDMEFWKKSGILHGEEIPNILEKKPCAIAGMIKAIKENEEDIELIYGLSMSCQSGGPAEQDVMDYFLENFLKTTKDNLPLDGVFLSFHGAMQSTEYEDVEGEITKRIREVVGKDTILAASTDLHAYISPLIMEEIDVICAYHTYPHIDLFETGYRTAKIGLRYIMGDNPPKMARAAIPMIVSAAAYNTIEGKFKELIDYGKSLVEKGTLIDFAIYQMQPWLDISCGCSSTLAIAEDKETATFYAKELAYKLLNIKDSFKIQEYTIGQVIECAQKNNTEKPIILVDSADSCNAGANGDSMEVVKQLLEMGSSLKTATVVNSPEAAELAHKIGVGNTAVFKIGGSRDLLATSIFEEGYVKSLHDGVFIQEGPVGRGLINDIGKTAVIRIGNIDIVVCHWMSGNGDPQLYRAFGVEPSLYQLVVVKACTSFRAAYNSIAEEICMTDTPGAAPSNLMSLCYKKLPKYFYPWNSLEDYKIEDVIIAREKP